MLHPLRSGFCRSSMHNPNFRMWPTRKTFHEPRSQKRVTYSGLLRALKIPIVHLQRKLCGKGWKELQMMSSVVFQLVDDGRMQTNHVCLGDVIFIVKNWYVGIVLLKLVAYLACSNYSTHISQNVPQKWERRQSFDSEKKNSSATYSCSGFSKAMKDGRSGTVCFMFLDWSHLAQVSVFQSHGDVHGILFVRRVTGRTLQTLWLRISSKCLGKKAKNWGLHFEKRMWHGDVHFSVDH